MDSPLREPRPTATSPGPGAGKAPRRLPLSARKRAQSRAAAARIAARTTRPLSPEQRTRDPLSTLRNPMSTRWLRGLRATLGSIAVHAAIVGLGFLTAGGQHGRREQVEQKIVVEVKQPPPPPPLPPEPPQIEKAEERPAPPKVVKAPPPKAPPPPTPPEEPSKTPPPRVVGISMESTTEGGGGPAFAVGNTRQGTTADRAVKPEDVPKEAPPSSDEPAPGENKSASRLPSTGVKYTPPRRRREVKPNYPATLKAQGIEADVKVSLSIDATGKVTAVKILTPAAYPEFNDEAKAAGMKEDFEPAARDGNPIPYSLPFTYKFRLEDE
jgi:protein TonB